MAEHGFFHPERGYWQVTGDAPAEIRQAWPEGSVGVPIRPSALHEWINGSWVVNAPEALAAAKSTAHHRVVEFIERFLAQFTAGVPETEVASWSAKAAAAALHLEGTPQPMILAEAAVTGEDDMALAAKIVEKSNKYTATIGTTTGLRRATAEAIEAATTTKAVEATLEAALTKAKGMAKAMGLNI